MTNEVFDTSEDYVLVRKSDVTAAHRKWAKWVAETGYPFDYKTDNVPDIEMLEYIAEAWRDMPLMDPDETFKETLESVKEEAGYSAW